MVSDSSNPNPNPQFGSTQPIREINSRELLAGYREIIIRHGGELYRLTLTRNGKLILRK